MVEGSALTSRQRILRRIARRALPKWIIRSAPIAQLLSLRPAPSGVVQSIAGLSIEYSLDSLIGQLLYLHGEFESDEAAFIDQRLKSRTRAVVVDVGANIGLHTLRAAQHSNVQHVHAFEPGRSTFAILQRNIARNGLVERITAHQIAVSDRDGEATFHFCADDAYSSLTPDRRRPVQTTYAVPLTRLDSWAEAVGLTRIDLLKVDVEGNEPAVIAGAHTVLAKFRPEVLLEVYQGDRPGFSAEKLIQQINACGYRAFVLIDGRAVPFSRHSDEHFNYYFVPAEV